MLTKVGNEILIKLVAQTIPNYAMNVFLLPLELCRESVMSKFWWRKSTKDKEKHWMCWERMCAPKSKGGLGFRHIHDFNIALLGN